MIIRYIISRPLGTFMVMFALLILSIISLKNMPSSLLPDIKVPVIRVHFNNSGNTAHRLELDQLAPLRDHLSALKGLKKISSIAADHGGSINLRFSFQTDPDLAMIAVKEKLDQYYTDHPSDIEQPRVIQVSTTNMPMLVINIECQDERSIRFSELSRYCTDVLRRRLEQMEEVAFTDITGASCEHTLISINPSVILGLGLNVSDICGQIEQYYVPLSVHVTSGNYEYLYRFLPGKSSPATPGDLPIKTAEGSTWRLHDIADVEIIREKGSYFHNGRPAIAMAVLKSPDANLDLFRKKIDQFVDEVITHDPELNVTISADRAHHIQNALDSLLKSLYIGVLLSCIITFTWTRTMTLSFIMIITVPLSLMLSVLAMHLSGISFNIISISGLILATGLIIDNAIIVMDNIHQKFDRKLSTEDAVIRGTTEVTKPLITSLLTTIIIFLPLLFISDVAGALFSEQAIAVTCGLISSFLVSIFVIPNLMVFAFAKRRTAAVKKVAILENIYEHYLEKTLKGPGILLLLLLMMLTIGFCLFPFLGKDLFPVIPDNSRLLKLSGEGIKDPGIRDRYGLISLVTSFHGIGDVFTYIGPQDYMVVEDVPTNADEAYIFATFDSDRSARKAISGLMESFNKQFPGLDMNIVKPPHPFTRIFGDHSRWPEAQVSSLGYPEMPFPDSLRSLISWLQNNKLLLQSAKPALNRTISLNINHELSSSYKTGIDEVSNSLSLKSGRKQINLPLLDIAHGPLFVETAYSFTQEFLEEPLLRDRDEFIPLSYVTDHSEKEIYKLIRAGRLGPYFPLRLTDRGRHRSTRDLVASEAENRGLSIHWSDSLFMNKRMAWQFGGILLISLLLLYIVLTIQFNSLGQPLIILSEIIFDAAGALVFLYITGNTLNIMSWIGIIVMSGIIINDSILKLDAVNRSRKDQVSLQDAIINGGKKRFRSIVMTSLTTIISLTPVLFSPGEGAALQKPLAAAMIGGMITGTLVSLFYIPVAYRWLQRFSFPFR